MEFPPRSMLLFPSVSSVPSLPSPTASLHSLSSLTPFSLFPLPHPSLPLTPSPLFHHFSLSLFSLSSVLYLNFLSSLICCSVSEAVQVVSKKPIPPHVTDLVLEMCCNDNEGEDVDVPFIQYQFR